MIATVLTLWALLVLYVDGSKGNWWSGIALGAIALLAWIGHFLAVDGSRAYLNRIDYWAHNGEDRVRGRSRWYADEDDWHDDEPEQEEHAPAKRETKPSDGAIRAIGTPERSKMEDLFQTNNLRRRTEIVFCPRCGTKLSVEVTDWVPGQKAVRHSCPKCGAGLWI